MINEDRKNELENFYTKDKDEIEKLAKETKELCLEVKKKIKETSIKPWENVLLILAIIALIKLILLTFYLI